MSTEEFQKLIKNCQPHPVFKLDWNNYYSIDFADTFLPEAGGLEGTAYKIFDGAMLFEQATNYQKELLQVTDSDKLITLIYYTYPKGVAAEQKKTTVTADEHEVCVFLEISNDEKIDISLRFGNKLQNFLDDYLKMNKLSDSRSSLESKIYKTDIPALNKHFENAVTHYKLFGFIGKTIGVALNSVNQSTSVGVRIHKIKAMTSEPYDNAERKIKQKKRKFIVVDFEILYQPAVNYNFIVFKGKEEIYSVVTFPEITIKPGRNKGNMSNFLQDQFHEPGHYQILWDCTNNGIFESKNLIERLSAKVEVTGTDEKRAYALMEFLLKLTIENAEQDNSIIVNDKEVFASEILARQKEIKLNIGLLNFNKLPKEEQLIIDLPINECP